MPWIPLLSLLLGACVAEPGPESEPVEMRARSTAVDPFEPLPTGSEFDPPRVALGRRLFEDPRLSGGGDRSCADCHQLEAGGIAPGEARSDHPQQGDGPYNVPTVFNAALNFRLNWQGTASNLDEHFSVLMMNPRVMNAGSWPELSARLSPYQADFIAAGFPGGVEETSIRAVMVEYQESLLTPNAPFDQFLRGEIELSPLAAQGYERFKTLGCASCHQGMNVGGNLFQRFGVAADAFEGQVIDRKDHGRILLTGLPEDEFVFRVPSLRNVAVTAPYFHDGSAASLDAAVRHMGRVQLGYELSDEETAAIVAFLHTLTGEYEGVSLDAGQP